MPSKYTTGDAEEGAGDRLERGQQVRVVRGRASCDAVDEQAEDDRADERAEERADDPAPEAVGQEDREVPDGEAHHHPGEHGHQRRLPCRRLRGFFCLGFGGLARSAGAARSTSCR